MNLCVTKYAQGDWRVLLFGAEAASGRVRVYVRKVIARQYNSDTIDLAKHRTRVITEIKLPQ